MGTPRGAKKATDREKPQWIDFSRRDSALHVGASRGEARAGGSVRRRHGPAASDEQREFATNACALLSRTRARAMMG